MEKNTPKYSAVTSPSPKFKVVDVHEEITNLSSGLRTPKLFSVCNACQQRFPHPMHFPENHAVVPPQSPDLYMCDPIHSPMSTRGIQVTSTLKNRTGNLLTNNGQTLPPELNEAGTAGSATKLSKSARSAMMGDDIPIFPKAKSLFIHSGNIINWNRLKRKPNQTSTEEACECIGNTLGAYLETEDKTNLQYVTEIYKVNSENVQKLDENERDEVKITVKVFICMSQPSSVISEAVNKVLSELGTNFVETLLLAVSPYSGDNDDDSLTLSLSTIQPYWEAMEELVSADKVLSLGICDLNKDALEDLYNWSKVKPSIDQVNLESCCVMPQDLTEYAKSVNVQLLTHNDSPVFISEELLQKTIQNVSTEPDSSDWTPRWIVRYSGILKCRGIIKMKGYIFHAGRNNKIL